LIKAELVDTISEKIQEPRKNVAPIGEAVFDSITESLSKGEKCSFVGFGVFEVKNRASRVGRNPQNPSKTFKIPARKIPTFRPCKGLKEKVLAAKKIKKR
jgi:DNA-binding protein HU-beta